MRSPNGHADGARGQVTLGADGDGDTREPLNFPEGSSRRPAGPSTHLALIVVGIAGGLMVLGTVAAVLTGGTPAPLPSSTPTARGSPIRAVAARPELSSIITAGLPPDDVLASLALPRGTRVISGSAVDNGIGLYDHAVGFSVSASEQDVIEFFRAQLPSERWHVLSEGPASVRSDYQIVSQHPGSNGYEWELGVTVMPETFPVSPQDPTSSRVGPSSSGTTPFTLRLFEVTDEP
jgi:hypothetical protein